MKPTIKNIFLFWNIKSITNRGNYLQIEAENSGQKVKTMTAREYANKYSMLRFGVKVDELGVYMY